MEWTTVSQSESLDQIDQIDPMEIDIPFNVTVSQGWGTVPLTGMPKFNKPIEKRPHVVVDGFNLLASFLVCKNAHVSELGKMDVDRYVQEHQLNDADEAEMFFTTLREGFAKALPTGSHVEMYFKPMLKVQLSFRNLPDVDIWKILIETHQRVLREGDKNNIHTLVMVFPSEEVECDKECDDGEAIRELVKLSDEGKEAFLVSNDKYRSLGEHADLSRRVSKIGPDGKITRIVQTKRIGVHKAHQVLSKRRCGFQFCIDKTEGMLRLQLPQLPIQTC